MIRVDMLITEDDYYYVARELFHSHYGIIDCCNKIFVYDKELSDFIYFTDEIDDIYGTISKYRPIIPYDKRYGIIVVNADSLFMYMYYEWLVKISKLIPVIIMHKNKVNYDMIKFNKDTVLDESTGIERTVFFRIW